MIYLLRYTRADDDTLIADIAVVENASGTARYEAQGYARCTVAAFWAAWELRDARALRALWPEGELMERAVGRSDLNVWP